MQSHADRLPLHRRADTSFQSHVRSNVLRTSHQPREAGHVIQNLPDIWLAKHAIGYYVGLLWSGRFRWIRARLMSGQGLSWS
jgi:hypothetical protein